MEITQLKKSLEKIYQFAKENGDLSEEDLRAFFIKTDILRQLGYNEIGKDIKFEKTVPETGKRSDIQCYDEYKNIVFIIEFKKTSDKQKLRESFNQLWQKYVLPLKARYGILTNGLEIIIYKRIGVNYSIVLDKRLIDLNQEDCDQIYQLLRKPVYDMTLLSVVKEYFNKLSNKEEKRP